MYTQTAPRYCSGTSQGTSQITLYSKLTPQFSSSVSAKLGPQFTSSFSAGAREDPYSKIAALKYLNAHGCSNIDLYYKYSCVLDEKRALELFWVKALNFNWDYINYVVSSINFARFGRLVWY